MAYTSIDNPELYMQCKLYSGTGSSQAITFDGDENMSPDLVWMKCRSHDDNHTLFNTTSGATKRIFSNLTQQESTESTSLTSFDSDGFTLGSDALANASSRTFVAWAWKESADAGFDILKYEGNATNRTISHSLSAVPHWIIIKNLESTSSSAEHWLVYHKSIGNTHGLLLNQTDAKSDDATYFQDTDPTSSVFSIGTADRCNKNNEDNIAFLWSEKQGYSKFGSYRGSGSTNGPFIHLGFRPAWLLIKRSSAAGVDWILHDNKRAGFNVNDDYLAANTSAVEVTGNTFQNLDLLSNGFKIRGAGTGTNTSGATYVYMAFAESPFVNSKGVPNNAR
tara:strand:- start:816 stop:1823 length:1008 start_codon:yes stop_codon:yes gene_type:complete